MRVSFVMLGLKDHSTGGYVFNHQVADALSQAGHQVDVIHFSTIPENVQGSRFRGTLHVLSRLFRSKPELIVISKSYSFMWLARLYIALAGIPALYMVHHLEWHDRDDSASGLRKSVVKWYLSLAKSIWVNSRSTAQDVTSLGISSRTVSIIPPGLDRFQAAPYSERKLPLTIISVGTICPRKDQLTLIRSCAQIRDLSFRLVLAGDDESDPTYSSLVKSEVSKLDLTDRVFFSGHSSRDELEDAYGRSHIFANLSRWEGFGMAVAEALWAGLPVVAVSAGAVPELVDDGVDGFLISPGDVNECASKLRDLIENNELRTSMSENAIKKATKLFTWEDTRREFLKLAEKTASSAARNKERDIG